MAVAACLAPDAGNARCDSWQVANDPECSGSKRAVKHGRRAAEDLVDDAKYLVKQHPLSAVGVLFGIGLGLGDLIGVPLARNEDRGK